MKRFRKKPVEIRAVQWDGKAETLQHLEAEGMQTAFYALGAHGVGDLRIETLEGVFHASKGDWIIKGIKGEFYACKPDIFEATYEEVPDA
ncbi:MAG: hypothetical protein JRD89_02850 [Deltaproteobacteria bacterium]|nr:hypothetical protein [Deltaproteobacteria bacterium]